VERKVGDVFEWNNKIIMVLKSEPTDMPEVGCSVCAFNPIKIGELCNEYRNIRGECIKEFRKDNTAVHFVDIT
jgi:hypothetical protein